MSHTRAPMLLHIGQVAIAAATCALLIRVSLQTAVLQDGSSLLWLPTGAAVGLAYWWGYRVALVGFALALGGVAWLHWGQWNAEIFSGVVAGCQAVFLAWLLRWLQIDPRLRDWSSLALFAGVGVLGAPFVAINAYLTHAFGVMTTGHWLETTGHRWLGDWLGYLLMGSFLLVWWGNLQLRKRDYTFLTLLIGGLVCLAWLSFYMRQLLIIPAPSLALLLPPLALSAFLYQQRGATLLMLVAAMGLAIFAKGWDDTQLLEVRDALFGWLFLAFTHGTLMAVAIAVTQQRAYAQQLEHSRQELERAYQQVRNIFENAPTVAMQMYDHQGRILFWNRASERFYGYSAQDAEGKTLDALIFTPDEQQEFLEKLQQVRATGQPAPLQEWKVRTADGKERVILSSLFPIEYEGETRYICADIDITERKALEWRLFQAEKLESIGRLAGGVAHDFNNLLTAILGFAELAQTRLPPDHPVQQDIERIVQSSLRAANLVRQLLGYARKQLTQPRPVSMNTVIQELLPLLENILGKDITIQLHLTDQENTVLIDPAQLEQIVMNLTLNARDAMRNKENSVLTIAVERRFCSEKEFPPDEYEEPHAGEYVCLIVQDTGEGIPESARPHIFEPFFSTKGVGNTGLGLATVYGIVRQNRGFITVESEAGSGATFTICLPAWGGQVQSHTDDPSRTPPDAGNY